MSRYSRYFLQNILWLEDGLCRYYVQDRHWCHEEILDVPVVVYGQERDAEQMLWACVEHNAFYVIDQLRAFLTDDCCGYHFVHKMSDQEVVKAAADELTHHIYQVVIEPGSGWAVHIDEITEQAALPVSVEPEPELATIFEELKEQLDGLVSEQRKKYDQYEAQLAKMSETEKAALYGKKAATGSFSFVGDILNMVKAFPGFYVGYLKTVGKIALYPSQLSAVMAESIATGSMGPLEAEIDKFVKPIAQTHEEVKRYKGMLQVLLTDKETLELLHDFAERFYDATHPLELTEMGASAATDIVVTVLLAIFTAGVGAAANVAAKSAKLVKVAKLLERLAKVLKRVGYKHKLPKKKVSGAQTGADIKKKPGKPAKRGMPEPESPKPENAKIKDKADGKDGGSNKDDKEKFRTKAEVDREKINTLVKAGNLREARNVIRPYMENGQWDEVVARLDVSSPKDGAVFWSGAKDEAATFARDLNLPDGAKAVTLEDTVGGKVLDNWSDWNSKGYSWDSSKGEPPPYVRDLWAKVSTEYAEKATGKVYSIQAVDKLNNPNTIWNRIEKPILEDRQAEGFVSEINIIKI